jgi:hypothetical protein
MRTFSRAHWEASLETWDAGGFSHEWKPFRHQAAMRGIIYPPDGTRWDSWEDEDPSERAILVRAIRETPALLREAIARRDSWSGVVQYVVHRRDAWRAELAEAQRDEPDPDLPDQREATIALKRILDRIAWS